MSKSNTTTFYHIATNVDDFKSFFREGAKAVTPQSNKGFYVWTNEDLAETHFRLLDGQFLNKTLKNHEAMMLGFCVDKKEIKYPLWQMDVEFAPDLYNLLAQYTPALEQKKWNIDLPANDSFLKKITGFSCQKSEDSLQFIFQGKTSVNTDMSFCITHRNNQPCQNNTDMLFLQTLTDILCQENHDFHQAYDELMQSACTQKAALKYTGPNALPISLAKHMTVDDKGNIKKTTVFDKTKGSEQICPFLKIKSAQR